MSKPSGQNLRRVLSLPWLVFYGVGVTVGAGIFALIGEVVGVAGDNAPLAFLIAGSVAAFTGLSYAVLASVFPRAAGEAFFVSMGLGSIAGRVVGLGVVAVAITSSAVIALAFAGYVGTFTGLPEKASLAGVLVVLGLVAWIGVRESVGFAAIITVLEVGTLLAVVAAGLPMVAQGDNVDKILSLPAGGAMWSAVFAGAFVAFFAFIGFEDIENLAEETIDPHRAVPVAIVLTLVISVAIYALVATVAVAYPDRAALADSKAPLALMFESATGKSGALVAVMASIAMINGILVQIVMASRVLYGMARENMIPGFLGLLDRKRQTPTLAIALVTGLAGLCALFVPMRGLAGLTSLILLLVFATVNTSLFLIGRRDGAPPLLRRWRYFGLVGCLMSLALAGVQVLD